MIKTFKDYQSEIFPFPEQKDPELKSLQHCISYAQAIYSKFLRNGTGILYSELDDYFKLRKYGNGKQPEDIYRRYFLGDEKKAPEIEAATTSIDTPGNGWSHSKDAHRKGYMNVLWKVISIAPKVKSALVGKFRRAEYDVVANAVDPYSGAEQETQKYGLWFLKENMDFMEEYYANAGMDMQQEDFIPESLQELELYEMRGGFKPEYCKEMEKLVAHTFDISDWPGIKDNMMADAIDLGVFACREVFDEEERKFKLTYVDPEVAVVQYSKYNDFRDANFAGHFDYITIGELRNNLKNEKIEFKESDLEDVAKKYVGYLSNPNKWETEKYKKPVEADAPAGYDFFKISVFHCEWIEIDYEQTAMIVNRNGKKKPVTQKYGTKNKKGTDVLISGERYKYQCSWVVGSENLAYDFGKAYDILRPYKKTIALSYHFYKLHTPSITDQLIPLYDNFMTLWVKYQNALAMAVNRGYAINTTALRNVTADKTKKEGEQEAEAIRRFIQSGILFFKETNAMQQRNTQMLPVMDLPGGMGDVFMEIREGFRMNIEMVEQLTGVSPLALGSVDPKAPVGTSELSYQNTQDTLRGILNGYMSIKENSATNVTTWIQLKLKYDSGTIKSYEPVIGKNGIKVLMTASGKGVKYGIILEAQPTEIEKQEVYESAKNAVMSRRNGEAGITEADFFQILQIIQSGGSLKMAEMILQDRIRKNEQEKDRMAKENMMMQQEYALAQEDKKKEQKAMEIQLKSIADIRLEYVKAMLEVMVKMPEQSAMDVRKAEIDAFYQQMLSQSTPQSTTQQPGR